MCMNVTQAEDLKQINKWTNKNKWSQKQQQVGRAILWSFSVHILKVPTSKHHAPLLYLHSSDLCPSVYFPPGLLASPSCIICGKIVHVCLGQRWVTTVESIRSTQELFILSAHWKYNGHWAVCVPQYWQVEKKKKREKNQNLILNCDWMSPTKQYIQNHKFDLYFYLNYTLCK